jgi:tRNA (guanine-N7-)-methyltransferase
VGKDKLRRFAAIKDFENVFEPEREHDFELKGKWRESVFQNENPIVLELGCGKGEYAVGLGKHYLDKNFIGVDLKGNRIYIGAKEALETGMKNVVFLRSRIDYITNSFAENEVDEIWLTFSDPQPNKPRKRLTSPLFIERYRKILKPGGIIHVKTDSDVLFEYTEEQVKENNFNCLELTWDLYGSLPEDLDEETKSIFHIKTYYEKLFTSRGHVIKYCKFTLD